MALCIQSSSTALGTSPYQSCFQAALLLKRLLRIQACNYITALLHTLMTVDSDRNTWSDVLLYVVLDTISVYFPPLSSYTEQVYLARSDSFHMHLTGMHVNHDHYYSHHRHYVITIVSMVIITIIIIIIIMIDSLCRCSKGRGHCARCSSAAQGTVPVQGGFQAALGPGRAGGRAVGRQPAQQPSGTAGHHGVLRPVCTQIPSPAAASCLTGWAFALLTLSVHLCV